MKIIAMIPARDHHGDLLDHANGGNDRVQRKYDLEQQDLDNNARKIGPLPFLSKQKDCGADHLSSLP
jgi:hypothetical protein